ncbi:MAG: hypothetical protein J3R72DRAFT_528907 [Linnemannia gamsii]|nr:MAG: hypothetical protein J3R72DRAFT_528907 [Linnemannia gamsii]
MGLIAGIITAPREQNLCIRLDNQTVVKQFREVIVNRKRAELVRGHDGDEWNEKADLAVKEAQSKVGTAWQIDRSDQDDIKYSATMAGETLDQDTRHVLKMQTTRRWHQEWRALKGVKTSNQDYKGTDWLATLSIIRSNKPVNTFFSSQQDTRLPSYRTKKVYTLREKGGAGQDLEGSFRPGGCMGSGGYMSFQQGETEETRNRKTTTTRYYMDEAEYQKVPRGIVEAKERGKVFKDSPESVAQHVSRSFCRTAFEKGHLCSGLDSRHLSTNAADFITGNKDASRMQHRYKAMQEAFLDCVQEGSFVLDIEPAVPVAIQQEPCFKEFTRAGSGSDMVDTKHNDYHISRVLDHFRQGPSNMYLDMPDLVKKLYWLLGVCGFMCLEDIFCRRGALEDCARHARARGRVPPKNSGVAKESSNHKVRIMPLIRHSKDLTKPLLTFSVHMSMITITRLMLPLELDLPSSAPSDPHWQLIIEFAPQTSPSPSQFHHSRATTEQSLKQQSKHQFTAPMADIMAQGHWSSPKTFEKHYRLSSATANNMPLSTLGFL